MVEKVIKTVLLLAFISLASVACKGQQKDKHNEKHEDGISRIDTHIHLYDTEREGSVQFLDPVRHERIYYPHYPEVFVDTAGPAGVSHAIVVEASRRREDNFWLIEIIENSDATLAFIGNLDPRDPDYASDLESLAKYKKFRGFRIRPQTPISLSDPGVIEGLGLLVKYGLVLDLGHNAGSAEEITALARKYPGMNIIIDHIAGGMKKDGKIVPEGWYAKLEELASEPNIYCKVSMLYHMSGENPAPKDAASYRPLIDPVVDAFGPDRVMFGSNWTLSDMYGSYSDMIIMLDEYLEGRPDLSPEKFYKENAMIAHGLK